MWIVALRTCRARGTDTRPEVCGGPPAMARARRPPPTREFRAICCGQLGSVKLHMSYNPFHARQIDAAEQRSAADVFRSSAQASDAAINSRFSSGGKYTIEQLEAGADETAAPAEAPEFDPDDKRSLYERLQAQKDAKQEEFEHRNAFKNQM